MTARMRWLEGWTRASRSEARRHLEETRQAREVVRQQLANIERGLAQQQALRAEIQAQLARR